MIKKPEDRRARRSRRLLKQSLLALMEQKSFSEISVRDIADHADMNRGTFYLHYANTAGLLCSIEDDLFAQAQELIDARIAEIRQSREIRPVFDAILDLVVEQRETCSVLIRNDEFSSFMQRIQEFIRKNGAPLLRLWYETVDEIRMDYAVGFLTWGLTGLLEAWFSHDMQMPREQLLSAAERLTDASFSTLLP